MRTGAVAAHAIDTLAVHNFMRIGFMGLGNTAKATLMCLLALYPTREFEVGLLKYKDQHEIFAGCFKEHENVRFTFFNEAITLASWSQVFVSCVSAADCQIAPPDVFSSGSLLVPIHTRGFKECDLEFDRIVCDDEKHVAGFGYYPQFRDRLVEMADVIANPVLGRTDDSQRIIAYNIGIALHDVFFASKIYDMASSKALSISLRERVSQIPTLAALS